MISLLPLNRFFVLLFFFILIINSKPISAEEAEDIQVHVVSREQAMQAIEDGVIMNAIAIIGLQWLQANYTSLSRCKINFK